MKRFRFLFPLLSLLFFVQVFQQPVTAQINTDRMMLVGRNALYFEDYVLAIQYFNQVISAKPHLAEPYFYRAVAKLYLEDYRGAEEDCSKAIELNPFLSKAYLCRSYARLNLKTYEAAAEDCRKGLEFDQEDKTLMQNLALSQLYAKQYDEAEKTLRELIKRSPNYVYAYMISGQLKVEKGDTLGAVEEFSRAVASDRHFAPAYAARAYVYLLKEDYRNALPDLDEAIRLDPEVPGYYINRGLTRYNLNDLRGALDDLDRVISLDPNNELAYFNRGLIRSQVGDLNRAIEDFNKVIYLDPNHYVAIYNRALLRVQTGDYTGALADLNAIIKEYPKFTPALYQRSEVKRKAGDAKGADKDYFAAWRLDDALKAEREDRRLHPEKYAAADSLREAEREKKSDLDRYNRIILAESEEVAPAAYQNPMRGRVQDRNVRVEPEDLFILTFYEKSRPGPMRRPMDYSGYLKTFLEAGLSDFQRLRITNEEEALTDQQAAYHFSAIDELSKRLGQPGAPAVLFVARAIHYALVQDLNSALEDLDQAIQIDPDLTLAYFERANLRFRQLDVEQAVQVGQRASKTASGSAATGSASGMMSSVGGELFGEHTFGTDFELVLRDYEQVITRDPRFIYAWYTRGNIRCLPRDYRNALIDYSRAIEINPDFADAWYNRGVTRIYLGDRAHGIDDLRMAGQLGLYKAYNLIKRFE